MTTDFVSKHQGLSLFVHLKIIAICILALTGSTRADFIKGVDLSILKAAEDHGVQYKINGEVADPLIIFKQNGCNYVRLRLFVNPSGKAGQVNSLAYTLALAKRVERARLSLLLDFHYSDAWADPGHQTMPASWVGLTHKQLIEKMHDYTLATLKTFQGNGCLPDMVAIGNEITNGMLFPDGGPLPSEDRWRNLMELLASGVRAAREIAPPSRLKVMIHIDKGGVADVSEWFYKHCQNANLDFDVIGLSYYPFLHETFAGLRQNLASLSEKYRKDIIIAETGFDYSGDQGDLPYPTTPTGQKAFLEELLSIVSQTPGDRGKGVFYWEPAWIDHAKWGGPDDGSCDRRALFDADGNALPAIAAFEFNPSSAVHSASKP